MFIFPSKEEKDPTSAVATGLIIHALFWIKSKDPIDQC